jgi:hypothetical protein
MLRRVWEFGLGFCKGFDVYMTADEADALSEYQQLGCSYSVMLQLITLITDLYISWRSRTDRYRILRRYTWGVTNRYRRRR